MRSSGRHSENAGLIFRGRQLTGDILGWVKSAAIKSSCNRYRTGPRTPSITEMFKKSDRSLVHFQEHHLEQWGEHFKQQFTWLFATVDFPPFLAIELVVVDIRKRNHQ